MRGHCNYIVKLKAPGAVLLALLLCDIAAVGQVPDSSRQVLLALAADWDSARATLQGFQRDDRRSPWRAAFPGPWPVLLGRRGMAWGQGDFSAPADGRPAKTEKDGRAPAGVFRLGAVYGYDPAPPRGSTWPYVQVGPLDAWIDDPTLPHYNRHVRIDPRHVPEWFESQKMRLGDAAYRWLLEIRHNSDPPRPGRGSAIFFHVRRGPDRPSAGCTTMAREDLERIIRWLKPAARPRYVLLPREAYQRLREAWHLP